MGLSDFQEQRKWRKIFFSYPVAVLLVPLVMWSLWQVYTAFRASKTLGDEVSALERQIQAVRSARIVLEQKSQGLLSPEGIDKEARGRFNLKKPGEEVVIFVDEAYHSKDAPSSLSWSASLKKFVISLIPF